MQNCARRWQPPPCQCRSRFNASHFHLADAQVRLFSDLADKLQGTTEAAPVLKFDIAQQPLRARWTYCNECRRRCSPKETAETPGGVPVHYPSLGLHNCRRRDCKRIVDKDEGLRTAKEQACLAERQPSEVDLGERETRFVKSLS